MEQVVETGVPFSVCGFFTLGRQTLLTVSGNEWDLGDSVLTPAGTQSLKGTMIYLIYKVSVFLLLFAVYVRIFVFVSCTRLYSYYVRYE